MAEAEETDVSVGDVPDAAGVDDGISSSPTPSPTAHRKEV